MKEEDLAPIWDLVEEADAKELAQFVTEGAFSKINDGIWIRCWKMKLGKRILKSRMCVRGCFDPQRMDLATGSTTASRLSQPQPFLVYALKAGMFRQHSSRDSPSTE